MTRLLLAFLLHIIEVKVKLTRPLKAWTFTNLLRRSIVSEYLLVPCVHFATNGGTNESQSRQSEAKCQLQAVRSFWNTILRSFPNIALRIPTAHNFTRH